jgi:hypothetical protein
MHDGPRTMKYWRWYMLLLCLFGLCFAILLFG